MTSSLKLLTSAKYELESLSAQVIISSKPALEPIENSYLIIPPLSEALAKMCPSIVGPNQSRSFLNSVTEDISGSSRSTNTPSVVMAVSYTHLTLPTNREV